MRVVRRLLSEVVPAGTRRSFLVGLLGGLLVPKAVHAQTAGAICAANEVGTLRRGTGEDANRLLFCTDADLGGQDGKGAAKAWGRRSTGGTLSASFNVSSLTTVGIGRYRFNFAVAEAGVATSAVTCSTDENNAAINTGITATHVGINNIETGVYTQPAQAMFAAYW